MYIYDEKLRALINSVDGRESIITEVLDDTISLVQLSDTHYSVGSGSNIVMRNVVQEAAEDLRRNVKNWATLSDLKTDLDGCIISGDIVFARDLVEEFKKDGKISKTKLGTYAKKYQKWHETAAIIIKRGITQPSWLGSVEKRLLVVPGNHDVMLEAGPCSDIGEVGVLARSHSAYQYITKKFLASRPHRNSEKCECVGLPRLCLFGNKSGVAAIVGLDSNMAAYRYDAHKFRKYGLLHAEQIDRLKSLVGDLTSNIKDRPVYVVVVLHHHLLPVRSYTYDRVSPEAPAEILTNVTLDSSQAVETFQDNRVSLVLHGHMHKQLVQHVSYIPHAGAQYREGLTVVACPSYGVGEDTISGAIISLNLRRGTGRVDIHQSPYTVPISIPFPMISASRVSAGEMRIMNELGAWLDKDKKELPSGAIRECQPDGRGSIYKALVSRTWADTGYAQLCSANGQEFPLSETACPEWRRKKYFLLLLFRDAGGRPEILLNNHYPLRNSEYGEWNTLLMPAFKPNGLREFIGRVMSDLLRLKDKEVYAVDSRGEWNKVKIENVLKDRVVPINEEMYQLLSDKVTIYDTRTFVKFSPTDGVPQKYEYSLVGLDWFALKDGATVGMEKERSISLQPILNMLPSTNKDDVNNGAIRWQPEAVSKAVKVLGPGLVWFPLDGWQGCHAISSRNADVMEWVSSVVGQVCGGRLDVSRMPENISLGKLEGIGRGNTLGLEAIDSILPFDGEGDKGDELPSSLVAGLRSVKCSSEYDYRTVAPYRDSEISTVILRRDNDVINVHTGDAEERLLGVLRPVQKYVLKQGMKRIELLSKWFEERKQDPAKINGYLRVKLRGGKLLCHLPPIVETVWEGERDNDRGDEEFQVCDGTHRIVYHCWSRGQRLHAVLVRKPSIPYYAVPSCEKEWRVIADHPMDTTPELQGKYSARQVNAKEAKRILENHRVSSEKLYRRYFRDFSSAFGNIGGQGGRMV